MKRRLNYTNRRSFTREHVSISLQEQKGGQPPRFTAHIDIPAEWKLNPDARIYVEPYVVSTSMRFPFGTVKQIEHPADTTLRDVDAGNVLFRVKVVDESGEIGMLLAATDEVRPYGQEGEDAAGTRAFFPLVMKDLGQAVWKVEITKSDRPRLLLNNQIPGLREKLLADPLLQGAILPSAMHTVLYAMLASEEFSDAEWTSDWRTFVESLCGNSIFPPDDVDVDDDAVPTIISSAVEAFIEAKRFGENAKAKTAGGPDE